MSESQWPLCSEVEPAEAGYCFLLSVKSFSNFNCVYKSSVKSENAKNTGTKHDKCHQHIVLLF